ncbi:MAG: hypothetical protein AAF039_14185 [Bacteroidota bacterium]
MNGQELPYHQIPNYPEDYGSGNIVGRIIDGLGYRYHWASKDLRESDLGYRPSDDGQTALETLRHIYGLSLAILNAPKGEPNIRPIDLTGHTYPELRKMTLENLKKASNLVVGKTPKAIEAYKVVFKRGDRQYEFPLWNLINGQISDALYHTGQIVMMRRASGNPINPKVDVFIGKNRE